MAQGPFKPIEDRKASPRSPRLAPAREQGKVLLRWARGSDTDVPLRRRTCAAATTLASADYHPARGASCPRCQEPAQGILVLREGSPAPASCLLLRIALPASSVARPSSLWPVASMSAAAVLALYCIGRAASRGAAKPRFQCCARVQGNVCLHLTRCRARPPPTQMAV